MGVSVIAFESFRRAAANGSEEVGVSLWMWVSPLGVALDERRFSSSFRRAAA